MVWGWNFVCFLAASRNPFTPKVNFPSALARLWGGNSWAANRDDWTVPLGNFGQGRPTLPASRRGNFIPVFEEQPTTVIAYRLE